MNILRVSAGRTEELDILGDENSFPNPSPTEIIIWILPWHYFGVLKFNVFLKLETVAARNESSS
jgi:hypothetical protein